MLEQGRFHADFVYVMCLSLNYLLKLIYVYVKGSQYVKKNYSLISVMRFFLPVCVCLHVFDIHIVDGDRWRWRWNHNRHLHL